MSNTVDLLIDIIASRWDVGAGRAEWCLAELAHSTGSFARGMGALGAYLKLCPPGLGRSIWEGPATGRTGSSQAASIGAGWM